MSDDLKEKIMGSDSEALKSISEKVDPSIDFESEDKRHNHNLKKEFKDAIKKNIPLMVKSASIILIVFFILFVVILCRYLYFIWLNPDAIKTLLKSVAQVAGGFLTGILIPAVFSKKSQ